MTLAARDIPNLITIGRIGLTAPVGYLLLEEAYAAAMVLFLVAGISDGLDGYLAKRYGWHSRLGSVLDPLADKILLVISFVALTWVEVIPLWLLALVLGRDVVIVAGAVAYHFLVGSYEMAPTWLSKVNTTMQIVLVCALVFSNGVYMLPQWLVLALLLTVCATTILSGLDYVRTWGRKAMSALETGQANQKE